MRKRSVTPETFAMIEERLREIIGKAVKTEHGFVKILLSEFYEMTDGLREAWRTRDKIAREVIQLRTEVHQLRAKSR